MIVLSCWSLNFQCIFFLKYLFIYLFMAVLGLRFCARAFSSCGKRGPPLIAVRGPPTTAASLVAEHRLQTRRLSNCGSRAQPLRGMWDLPRAGPEPASPALAGRLPTTAPPGKPFQCIFKTLHLYSPPFMITVCLVFLIYLFIYLSLSGLDPYCCTRAFSSCSEWGLLFVAVRGLLIAVVSLVAEHGF